MKLEQFIKKGMAAQKVVDEITGYSNLSPEKQLKALKATPNYDPECPSCEKRRLTNLVAVRRSRKRKQK